MKIVFQLFLLIAFFSCQPTNKETILIKTEPVVLTPPETKGGTDSVGGGNGVNGIPLDAFIKRDFYKSKAYEIVIRPIIKVLSVRFPRMAADFYHITMQRDWYFVPGEVSAISKNILGSYAVTDQLALQDLNKVWINNIVYEKMTFENQGILVLHEIIMGIRLMEFQHRQDKCLAKAALEIYKENGFNLYQNEKNSCRKTYPQFDGLSDTHFQLVSNDYDIIRRIVSMLLDKNEIDIVEVNALIETYKVRIYED